MNIDDTTTARDIAIGLGLAAFIWVILALTGCNITAHVAARPVIDGTPVSIGVEVGR